MGDSLGWLGTAAGDVGDWILGAGKDVGQFYTGNQGWINPLLQTGISAALPYLTQGSQNKGVQQTAQQNQQLWQQTAYPNKAAVEASAIQNRGELGQARLGAGQNFFNNLAARGFMSGSGLGAKGQADIERAYAQTYGKMLTDQMKFANTPQQPFPQQAYYPQTQTPAAAAGKGATDYMSMAMGYQNMMNMVKQLSGGGTKPQQNILPYLNRGIAPSSGYSWSPPYTDEYSGGYYNTDYIPGAWG